MILKKANRSGGEYLHIWAPAIISHMYACIKLPGGDDYKKAVWQSMQYHVTNKVSSLFINVIVVLTITQLLGLPVFGFPKYCVCSHKILV